MSGTTRKKGLAAKISGDGVPEHEEPKLIKTIDFMNRVAVMDELKQFENDAVKKKIETACVITTDGEIYYCYGVETGVFPDFDLKNKIKNGIISHNHPRNVTSYTFSKADLSLFLEYDLETLRGCDELYTYEFSKKPREIDDAEEDWMNEENFEHNNMIDLAKRFGIGYRRWKNG